jgi:F-type H+-transporting ATPase subunit delta
MAADKQLARTSRMLFRLSLADGRLAEERVLAVLEWFAKTRPPKALALLRAYHRLVAAEIARNRAVVEHAGELPPATLALLVADFSRRYGRPISAVPQENPALIGGVRVTIGDDVYERTIAGQLATLAVNSA